MQTQIDVTRLKPLGTKVLVKRPPEEVEVRGLVIPEEYRDRNELKGQLYQGIVIAVGDRTRSACYGHGRDWFEPGDLIHFFHLWDWKDNEVVLKDEETGDQYLLIEESDVKAFEMGVGA